MPSIHFLKGPLFILHLRHLLLPQPLLLPHLLIAQHLDLMTSGLSYHVLLSWLVMARQSIQCQTMPWGGLGVVGTDESFSGYLSVPYI